MNPPPGIARNKERLDDFQLETHEPPRDGHTRKSASRRKGDKAAPYKGDDGGGVKVWGKRLRRKKPRWRGAQQQGARSIKKEKGRKRDLHKTVRGTRERDRIILFVSQIGSMWKTMGPRDVIQSTNQKMRMLKDRPREKGRRMGQASRENLEQRLKPNF